MKHKSKFKSVLKLESVLKFQEGLLATSQLRNFTTSRLLVLSLIFSVVALQSVEARYTADFLTLGVGSPGTRYGRRRDCSERQRLRTLLESAGLGHLTRYEVSFMHSTLNGEDAYDFVGFVVPLAKQNLQDKSQPLKRRGAIGVSWLRVGVDDIPITSLPVVSRPVGPMNRPEVVGSFNNTDNAFLFAYGWRLPTFRGIHLHLGGTLNSSI